MVSGATDFIGGCLGGIVGVLVSHPLDTVRTRQAMDKRSFGVICREMHRKEGPTSFYKGIYSPIIMVGAWKAITLGLHSNINSMLTKYREVKDVDALSMIDVALSASVSGSLSSAICTPFEQIKSRAMLEAKPTGKNKGGSLLWSELRQLGRLVELHGIQSLFRGLSLLLLRDGHATAVFLGTYEWCKRRCSQHPFDLSPLPASCIAGAISGPAGWVACYPVEVVRINFHNSNQVASWAAYRAVVQDLYRKGGVSMFFRGLPVCCARSSVQIAATMVVFEAFRQQVCV